MPFGIKNPFEYTRPGRTVTHPESYDSCPICGKDNPVHEGRYPVAPCFFPPKDLPDYDLVVVLGCSSCYQAQKRYGFNTVQALIDFKADKANKPAPIAKKPAGRSRKARSTSCVGSLSESDKELLSQAYELIGRILGQSTSVEIIGRPDSEDSDLARRASSQDLPDDDLEFGMTDEQRARMDQAVHAASERTKLIPSEAWNGKTADEILGDGVPNGW